MPKRQPDDQHFLWKDDDIRDLTPEEAEYQREEDEEAQAPAGDEQAPTS